MIEKIYENKFGVIHYVGLKKDLETIKTNEDYLSSKANGSKFYNIEDLSNSLVWNEEGRQWIEYDARGINTDDYVLKEALDNYVLKEQGKGLSTEDFTTFYKEKLDNLEAISAQIVDELPETGDKNCYYFVPDNQSEGTNNDFYVTFMYFETLGWKTMLKKDEDNRMYTNKLLDDRVGDLKKEIADTKKENELRIEELKQENKEDKQMFRQAIDSFNISVREFSSIKSDIAEIKEDISDIKDRVEEEE